MRLIFRMRALDIDRVSIQCDQDDGCAGDK